MLAMLVNIIFFETRSFHCRIPKRQSQSESQSEDIQNAAHWKTQNALHHWAFLFKNPSKISSKNPKLRTAPNQKTYLRSGWILVISSRSSLSYRLQGISSSSRNKTLRINQLWRGRPFKIRKNFAWKIEKFVDWLNCFGLNRSELRSLNAYYTTLNTTQWAVLTQGVSRKSRNLQFSIPKCKMHWTLDLWRAHAARRQN